MAGKRGKKKEEGKKKGMKEKKGGKKEETSGFKGIVRIVGKDIKGEKSLKWALLEIKGFGHTLSHAVAKVIEEKLGIPPERRVGELSEEELKKVEELLRNVHRYLPSFMLNRCKDYVSGKDVHVIMNDLGFAVRQDIEREKNIFTWRGFRHMYGQKVRGQRTKNTGRTGIAVGVVRKKK